MTVNELTHHGIMGQKWGIRRFQNKDGSLTAAGKARSGDKDSGNSDAKGKKSSSTSETKTSKTMSDDELRSAINRLELEKKYKELMRSVNPPPSHRGRNFVLDVMEKSGKNVATQWVTYELGSAVNKLSGKNVVNPKKGQKDK